MRTAHPDPQRTLKWGEVNKGWDASGSERSYWIPSSLIDGEIPKNLRGTLFRIGPSRSKVNGIKLKHILDGDGLICSLTIY
eukprot:UN02584